MGRQGCPRVRQQPSTPGGPHPLPSPVGNRSPVCALCVKETLTGQRVSHLKLYWQMTFAHFTQDLVGSLQTQGLGIHGGLLWSREVVPGR